MTDWDARRQEVVVCGDLNDELKAATTQILQGPTGSEIGTEGFKRDDKGDGYRLWNLAPILNEGLRGNRPPKHPSRGPSKGVGG